MFLTNFGSRVWYRTDMGPTGLASHVLDVNRYRDTAIELKTLKSSLFKEKFKKIRFLRDAVKYFCNEHTAKVFFAGLYYLSFGYRRFEIRCLRRVARIEGQSSRRPFAVK